MKGIVLAGGTGSRLWPITKVTSKQLIPIYDKPMIYYPLSVLFLAGIREILIICTPSDLENFKSLLGDGSSYGVDFQYKTQESPDGLAQAYLLGEHFLDGDSSLMVLGDNIFHGNVLGHDLKSLLPSSGAHIFTYVVDDPSRYGILEVDQNKEPSRIEEKPVNPKSNLAVTGLYFFDNRASQFAKNIKPSTRGELEITSLIEQYLQKNELTYTNLGRGNAWLDTGTPESLLEASTYIAIVEKRTGLKIACLEEIALHMGFIDNQQLESIISKMGKNSYRDYLEKINSTNQ
jgi:glucose-1-phosphate thymidylyltransferase